MIGLFQITLLTSDSWKKKAGAIFAPVTVIQNSITKGGKRKRFPPDKKGRVLVWTYFRNQMITIIGPGLFNCRVRDGNGCGPRVISTGTLKRKKAVFPYEGNTVRRMRRTAFVGWVTFFVRRPPQRGSSPPRDFASPGTESLIGHHSGY